MADVQRTEALRTAYESARNSADETHRLYLAGRESFISDLDATRTLTSAQAQVAAAGVATDRLFLALGGVGIRRYDGRSGRPSRRDTHRRDTRDQRVITAALSSSVHHAHLETLGGGELS